MQEFFHILSIITIVWLSKKAFYRDTKNGLLVKLKSGIFEFEFFTNKKKLMAATITINQKVSGQVTAVDRKGNPAQVEAGSFVFDTSDPEVCVISQDPEDESKFTVTAVGFGVAQVTVSADADLGEGVETISAFAAVEVTAEKAVGFGFTFGEPTDKE